MFETEYRQLVEKVTPSEELVSDTLLKMQGLMQSKRPVRRVRGTVILLAVLLLGVLGASAIALGGIKIVNRMGEDVTEEKLPDYKTLMDINPGEKLAGQLLDKAPKSEYWAINFDNSHWTFNTPTESIASLEEFESRIASAGSKFLIPRDVPEGYRFEYAELTFHLTEKTMADGFAFLIKEVMDEGVTVFKYRLPDSVKENIAGYSIRFKKGGEQYLRIRCDLGNLGGNQYFFLNEEDSNGVPVTVKGMLDCLYLQRKSDNCHQLYLRTMYLPNEKVIPWPDGSVDIRSSLMGYVIFNTLEFHIDSNTLDKDQMIKVAQGLR